MNQNYINYHSAWLGKKEELEMLDTLRGQWLTTGPKTKQFEREFAAYKGVKHAIAVNSCTAGLHLALKALKIGPGDEVITTSMTFVATINVIEHVGATPVFVDIDPSDLNIDANLIETKITTRTKALIIVHFSGRPCNMSKIMALAKKYKLKVIEDCAHAVETTYKGRPAGTFGDVSAFSFYATKNITTGEGGMVITNKRRIADAIRILSLHGLSANAWKRFTKNGFNHYEALIPGFKYNMSDVQASLGLVQLSRIHEFLKRRKAIVAEYDKAFAEAKSLRVLPNYEDQNNILAHHLYVLVIERGFSKLKRDDVIARIMDAGVGIGVHYRPVHLHKFYKNKYHYSRTDLPVSSYVGDNCFSLPLYPKLSNKEVRRVIDTVLSIVSQK